MMFSHYNVRMDLLPDVPTAIDAGAAFGEFCLPWASMGGRVVGLEPIPYLARELQKNVDLSDYGELVTVVTAALDIREGPGTRLINIWKDNHESTSFYLKNNMKTPDAVVRVNTLSLADVIRMYLDGRPPDLLKMDIEGEEFEILLTADLTGIPQIIVEFHRECEADGQYDGCWKRLGELDYVCDGHHGNMKCHQHICRFVKETK